LQGAAHQRCRVHFARNLFALVPKTHTDMAAAVFRTIFAQPDPAAVAAGWDEVRNQLAGRFPKIGTLMDEAKAEVLAFAAFPRAHGPRSGARGRPDGGGWRAVGRAAGGRNSRASAPSARGYGYIHSAVDDHSRLAYSEILPDEQATTAVAFWQRAQAFFAGHGITVRRVLTDNGSCYRSRLWRRALATAGIAHKRTRPYRPRTNGKVERYQRTMLLEWANARPYRSETVRRRAFARWQHIYNHHRPHTALGGKPPISRVTNQPPWAEQLGVPRA
jgi:hypothetical protein